MADTESSLLLLMAAVEPELRAAASALRLTRRGDGYVGTVAGCKLVAEPPTGMGLRCVERVDRALRTIGPGRLIWVGFAGAVDPALGIGQVVVPQRIMSRQLVACLSDATPRMLRHACTGLDGARADRWFGDSDAHYGAIAADVADEHREPQAADELTMVTVDRTLTRPDDKRWLAAQTGAVAADMEGIHLAHLAQRHRARLTIIRAISDGVEDSLPACVDRWVSDRGRPRPWRAVGDLCWRPWEVGAAIRLGRHARVASAALGVAVAERVEGS